MPLLTNSSTHRPDPDRQTTLFEEVAERYADVTDGRTAFLSVKFESVPREDIWLGRADPDADVALLEADVREGRPVDRRRTFALDCMEKFHDEWAVPYPNM